MKKSMSIDSILRWARKKFVRRPKARFNVSNDSEEANGYETEEETTTSTDSAERLATALAECQLDRSRLSRALVEADMDRAAELAGSEARADRLLAGRERELTRIADALAESETERGHLESRLFRSETERERLATALAEREARAQARLERRLLRSEAELAASRAQNERLARALSASRAQNQQLAVALAAERSGGSTAAREEECRRLRDEERASAERRVRTAECETLLRRVAAKEARAAWLRAELERSEKERGRLGALLKERDDTRCRTRAAAGREKPGRPVVKAAAAGRETGACSGEDRRGPLSRRPADSGRRYFDVSPAAPLAVRVDDDTTDAAVGRGPVVVGRWTTLEEGSTTTTTTTEDDDRSLESVHGWSDVDEWLFREEDFGPEDSESGHRTSTSYFSASSSSSSRSTDRFYSEKSTTTDVGSDLESLTSTLYFSASSSSCSADTFYTAY